MDPSEAAPARTTPNQPEPRYLFPETRFFRKDLTEFLGRRQRKFLSTDERGTRMGTGVMEPGPVPGRSAGGWQHREIYQSERVLSARMNRGFQVMHL